ncbi:hypothetical protein CspHIS471_0109510 [Cutaneotrichosporon sp. HIS471]|nr:hypothetical protein CspHIS471_0109510 [Cutaneotrichosporon sp. HIS471]
MSVLERRRPAPPSENEGTQIDEQDYSPQRRVTTQQLFKGLSWLDRLLSILILVAMVIGVVIGKFVPNTKVILSGATLDGVSIPISLVLNWLIAPFLMLGLAWATLPDQPTYRTGVIMVGLARCIAMVMIWNHLARGDINYCAILVIVNSVLQIALYSPMSLFFVNIISKEDALRLEYGKTAIAVLIYLGIPLAAGVVTRFVMMGLLGMKRFEGVFLPWFGPLSLIGLLYTIIVICAEQATRILDNIGLVFRTFVPLTLYFVLMWVGTFALCFYLNHKRGAAKGYSYETAVVQAFTAASNNFELAIAVCVAVYGVDSDQALAATIGPLVEVPVLLILTHVALRLKTSLNWDVTEEVDLEMEPLPAVPASAANPPPPKLSDDKKK